MTDPTFTTKVDQVVAMVTDITSAAMAREKI